MLTHHSSLCLYSLSPLFLLCSRFLFLSLTLSFSYISLSLALLCLSSPLSFNAIEPVV